MTLTVGSLFSGIGGLDLGLERAGMKVIWQSEIDLFANKILKKHWPEVVNHGNIKEINWEQVERPNVICGGYPCQPFSTAGKRKGEEDPRHLWPWVRDAISRLRPDYAILENVRGHLTLGGLSVIGELASIGYDAEWRIVSAASVGANHRRDRIIIVAYPNGAYEQQQERGMGERSSTGRAEGSRANASRCREDVAHPDSGRVERSGAELETTGFSGSGKKIPNANCSGWQGGSKLQVFQEERSRLDESSQGARWSNHWKLEPNVGRVAHGVSNRVDRLRGLGNAVVPQVAEVIGRLVVAHDAQRP